MNKSIVRASNPAVVTIPMKTVDGKTYHVDSLVCQSGNKRISGGRAFSLLSHEDGIIKISDGKVIELDDKDLTIDDGGERLVFRPQVTVSSYEMVELIDYGQITIGDNPLWFETIDDDGKVFLEIKNAVVVVGDLKLFLDAKTFLWEDLTIEILNTDWLVCNAEGSTPWVELMGKIPTKLVVDAVKNYYSDAISIRTSHRNALRGYMDKYHPNKLLNQAEIEALAKTLVVNPEFEHFSVVQLKRDLRIAVNNHSSLLGSLPRQTNARYAGREGLLGI